MPQLSARDADAPGDGRETACPTGLPVATIEMLNRWLELSELERRSFIALARELTLSSDLVETSTVDLSERFQALATLAQGQFGQMEALIAAAQSIEVGGEAVPLDDAMQGVGDILLKVIDTILSVSKHAMRMVYALDDIARDVTAAESCVAQIDLINTQTRYLALNALIEASRSGAAGAAFGVIANEMKDLSRATEETSHQVRTRIAALSSGVRNGHQVLQEIATLDMSDHLRAKQRLDGLIAGVLGQNRAFTAVLQNAATASADIAATIGRLITGMQFQDRAKQHLGQVIGAMGVLQEATTSLQAATRDLHPNAFPPPSIDEAWLNRVLERQTLGAMKQRILSHLLSGDEPDEPGDLGESIELF